MSSFAADMSNLADSRGDAEREVPPPGSAEAKAQRPSLPDSAPRDKVLTACQERAARGYGTFGLDTKGKGNGSFYMATKGRIFPASNGMGAGRGQEAQETVPRPETGRERLSLKRPSQEMACYKGEEYSKGPKPLEVVTGSRRLQTYWLCNRVLRAASCRKDAPNMVEVLEPQIACLDVACIVKHAWNRLQSMPEDLSLLLSCTKSLVESQCGNPSECYPSPEVCMAAAQASTYGPGLFPNADESARLETAYSTGMAVARRASFAPSGSSGTRETGQEIVANSVAEREDLSVIGGGMWSSLEAAPSSEE